jgi:hypothetical protein
VKVHFELLVRRQKIHKGYVESTEVGRHEAILYPTESIVGECTTLLDCYSGLDGGIASAGL